MGHVYLIEDEIGRVKIGRSKNPNKRILSIVRTTGMNFRNIHITEDLKNYGEIENIAISAFNNGGHRIEWVTAKYDDVLSFLDKLVRDSGDKILSSNLKKRNLGELRVLVNKNVKRMLFCHCRINKQDINSVMEEALRMYFKTSKYYDEKLSEVL